MEIKACYRDAEKHANEKITIQGWIRQSRISKNVGFFMVNGGTFFRPLQVVLLVEKSSIKSPSDLSNTNRLFLLSIRWLFFENFDDVSLDKILSTTAF